MSPRGVLGSTLEAGLTAVLRGLRATPGLRILAAWGFERSLQWIAIVGFVVALVWAAVGTWPGTSPGPSWIADTKHYFGAGERLNAGHDLYRLSAGDRRLSDDPFAFAGPFLYPPLVGVLWRPLALLPFEPTVFVWWLAGLVVCSATIVWLIARGGWTLALGTLVLLVPLSLTAWSGNVQAFLTPLTALAWVWLARGRERLVGSVLGFGAVLKLSPVFLVWWLLATGRTRAAGFALLAALVGFGVALVGAGWTSHLEYLEVARTVSRFGGTEASLGGILRSAGASEDVRSLVPVVDAVGGSIAVFALRRRPRVAWSLAVVTAVLASTVMNLTNVSLLLAAFVPWGNWRETLEPAGGPSETRSGR